MISISGPGPNSLLVGPPSLLKDNYSGPANPACFLTLDSSNDWAGQSFTTSQKYNLEHVDLWIKKGPGANVGNVIVKLYAVDGSGHPTGSSLNYGIIPDADVAEDYSWVSCYLNDRKRTYHLVSADTKYCIVVHGDSLNVDNPLIWACGGDGSDYPDGDREWSIDGGDSWTTDDTRDQLFRCYHPPFYDNYSGSLLPDSGISTCNSANDWCGNSFTAMKSYTLNRIDVWFHKDIGMDVGDIIVELYLVDGSGEPTGGVLTSGIIHNTDVPEGSSEWLRCDVTPYDIVIDTKYAFIIRGLWLGPSDVIRVPWDYYDYASDFEGGDMLWSMTGGASWFIYTDKDKLFRCYPSA